MLPMFAMAQQEKGTDIASIIAATPEEISEGWYQIRAISGTTADMYDAINAGNNYIHTAGNEYRKLNTEYYPLEFSAIDVGNPVTTFLYITPGNPGFCIKALNGHYVREKPIASRTPKYEISITGTDGNLVIGNWSAIKRSNSEMPYVGKASNGTSTTNIMRVPEEILAQYDIYSVNIQGEGLASEIGRDVQVTCSNSNNLGLSSVFDYGYFFFAKGTEVKASDFSINEREGYRTFIEIEGYSINISYAATGIEEIPETGEDSKVIYDLLGREAKNPGNGIYIINGKKRLIKQGEEP